MIEIEGKILSTDLFTKAFVCDLSACKGECCIAGNAGAPVAPDEIQILDEIYPVVAPYLQERGRAAIEAQGTSVDGTGERETPLIGGAECAYTVFDQNNTALCGIEQAYIDGKISWKKPLSCHLYPIRVVKYTDFEALNYDRWPICKDACALGEQLKVPVYKFLKDPLIRAYGEDWYQKVEEAANDIHNWCEFLLGENQKIFLRF